MISGGNATVYVSDMDRAVNFYTVVLGLRLSNRFGDRWATVDAGPGLTIGLHPASPTAPAPGTKGAVHLGLQLDEPIETVLARLRAHHVTPQGSIIRAEGGAFASIEDPDGNPIYLWETTRAYDDAVAGAEEMVRR